ncbi:hypothetical protein AYO08_12490 [Pseudomonas putida]|nr:hypothetical protein AYO08_12490 [Pseudomonas putida]
MVLLFVLVFQILSVQVIVIIIMILVLVVWFSLTCILRIVEGLGSICIAMFRMSHCASQW